MDNIKIIETLNALNLTKTAEMFKKEVGTVEINEEYKKQLLTQIYNQLNSNNDKEQEKEKDSKVQLDQAKSKLNNMTKNLLPKEKNENIMKGLISKIAKNLNNNISVKDQEKDNRIDSKDNNNVTDKNNIESTSVYKKLYNKLKTNYRFSKYDNNNKEFPYMNSSNNYNNYDNSNSKDYAYLDLKESLDKNKKNKNKKDLNDINDLEEGSLPRFGTGMNISLSKDKETKSNIENKFKLDLNHLPNTIQDKLNSKHTGHHNTNSKMNTNDLVVNTKNKMNESFLDRVDSNENQEDDSFGNFNNDDGENPQTNLLNSSSNQFKIENSGLLNDKSLKEVKGFRNKLNNNVNETEQGSSFFLNNSSQLKRIQNENENNTSNNEHNDKDSINSQEDEYVDDDDPGFDLYECEMQHFSDTCKKLSEQYDFPRRAIKKKKQGDLSVPVNAHNEEENKVKEENKSKDTISNNKDDNKGNKDNKENSKFNNVKIVDPEAVSTNINKGEKVYEVEILDTNKNENNNNRLSTKSLLGANAKKRKNLLPSDVKYMPSGDVYYPILFNNTIYDSFYLNVIVDRERTGFEEFKEFKVIINSLIAGRYQVLEYLGSAVFSKALKCLDILKNRIVCLKIIENNKDYLDQSIDEIKIMRYINANGDVDDKNVLKLYDYFYHKEHLFIVTEILKDNLYEFYKYIIDKKIESYFTIQRIQSIAKQALIGLEYIHSLKVIHCDLKPENILIRSISKGQIKIIDFGSSCFLHDHLSNYMQSRSYRAPEVILGLSYDYKIDIWSLGCILAELWTGNVLFQNDSIQSYLAKILSICGAFPEYMYKGKNSNDFFCKQKLIFMEVNDNNADNSNFDNSHQNDLENLGKGKKKMHLLIPKKTTIKDRLKCDDKDFVSFIKKLVEPDQNLRLSASEALKHPFILKEFK